MTNPSRQGADLDGRRITIRQIAERAGVSVGAASYALNDRPGVSETTRTRVISIARDLGWAPNPAARALSASRANAVGFASVRPTTSRTIDTWFLQMLAGMQSALHARGRALVFHVADSTEEVADLYRTWWAGRHVEGVVMTDLTESDPRLEVAAGIGLPAVLIGGDPRLPNVSTISADTRGTTTRMVQYLLALGHRSIARVAGPPKFIYTRQRDVGFEAAVAAAPESVDSYTVVYTDYTAREGMAVTRDLLGRPDRPTAIIYDNDVMASSSLLVADEMGVRIPDELSVVAWDDSDLCTLVRPSITAVAQHPIWHAEWAVKLLLDNLDGHDVQHLVLPETTLVPRQSTGLINAPRTERPSGEPGAAPMPQRRRKRSAGGPLAG